MRGVFLPSMIEVGFGDYYKRCAELLFNEGFKSFHIDFGDNKLIGRELEPWDKVSFLKSLGSGMRLTAHIMCMSGDHSLSVEKITDRCIEEGFEIIYIHPRSFSNLNDLLTFKERAFKNAHHIFGIVSELDETTNQNLVDFVADNSIKNLLQMGVPIGRGGQKFGWSATDRIEDFTLGCSTISNVELDGGLTFDVLRKLQKSNIGRFAGWSLVADTDPLIVLSRALEVKQLI
tara:strand:- start:3259 stop:3954 length:696 start_codon:yes stop_codon:yes gene_type:complete